ncbi:MAG: hypothetical protein COU81_03065 [Candidatus Portnoybacteria bacterium CG10_big_fil_rev_8_21_14_0_10_36_7]|uniref:Uncharacterized protein n=1 Tax=Candidatus Portnoybacteria bacterium CG10_big_fil_rev_8_21_14_0_10_36_7 TaxID=1974812 RepID=A0A2M8KDI7_9BACT|nr:MAG: hypothetical protein COU81_03065 [Candidatus Portnoybacteria bacterium CG10_big_fil_rev_8_21_14_0_10_36_7]
MSEKSEILGVPSKVVGAFFLLFLAIVFVVGMLTSLLMTNPIRITLENDLSKTRLELSTLNQIFYEMINPAGGAEILRLGDHWSLIVSKNIFRAEGLQSAGDKVEFKINGYDNFDLIQEGGGFLVYKVPENISEKGAVFIGNFIDMSGKGFRIKIINPGYIGFP